MSAFGFGGTNFHVVLEEYVPGRHRAPGAARSFAAASHTERAPAAGPAPARKPLRGAAVVVGADDADVAGQLERLAAEASAGRAPEPAAPDPAPAPRAPQRIAIDYADAAELAAKADKAAQALRGENPAGNKALWSPAGAGVFIAARRARQGRVPLHRPGLAVREHAGRAAPPGADRRGDVRRGRPR